MARLSINGCVVEIFRDPCCVGGNIYDTVLNWYKSEWRPEPPNTNRWGIWVTCADERMWPMSTRRVIVSQPYALPVPEDDAVVEFLLTELGLELTEWAEVQVLISHSERWGIMVQARLPDTVEGLDRRLEVLMA